MTKSKSFNTMIQVNIHEAKTHRSKLINDVLNGEDVVIAKKNKPVVKMTAFEEIKPKRCIGTLKGQIHMSPDFDEPLEDFKEYME